MYNLLQGTGSCNYGGRNSVIFHLQDEDPGLLQKPEYQLKDRRR